MNKQNPLPEYAASLLALLKDYHGKSAALAACGDSAESETDELEQLVSQRSEIIARMEAVKRLIQAEIERLPRETANAVITMFESDSVSPRMFSGDDVLAGLYGDITELRSVQQQILRLDKEAENMVLRQMAEVRENLKRSQTMNQRINMMSAASVSFSSGFDVKS